MDRTEALTKLTAFAKSWAEELRSKANKDHLDDYDLQATERIAAELDEAAKIVESEPHGQTVGPAMEVVCLEVDEARCDILDRALTGFTKALQTGRDMGVISHDTFCKEADAVRVVHYLVYDCQSKLAAKIE